MKKDLKILEEKQESEIELINSLKFLSRCLYEHYDKKVIILIDEYDVPLKNASEKNFYDDMFTFMSMFLSKGLKYNEYVQKGVLTGCLTITKQSISTGLNNIEVRNLLENKASEYYGLTQGELDEMLDYYSLLEKRDIIKEWYDGYLFGNNEIYNPWSVLKYISALQHNSNSYPQAYWLGTSRNEEIYEYIQSSDFKTKKRV